MGFVLVFHVGLHQPDAIKEFTGDTWQRHVGHGYDTADAVDDTAAI